MAWTPQANYGASMTDVRPLKFQRGMRPSPLSDSEESEEDPLLSSPPSLKSALSKLRQARSQTSRAVVSVFPSSPPPPPFPSRTTAPVSVSHLASKSDLPAKPASTTLLVPLCIPSSSSESDFDYLLKPAASVAYVSSVVPFSGIVLTSSSDEDRLPSSPRLPSALSHLRADRSKRLRSSQQPTPVHSILTSSDEEDTRSSSSISQSDAESDAEAEIFLLSDSDFEGNNTPKKSKGFDSDEGDNGIQLLSSDEDDQLLVSDDDEEDDNEEENNLHQLKRVSAWRRRSFILNHFEVFEPLLPAAQRVKNKLTAAQSSNLPPRNTASKPPASLTEQPSSITGGELRPYQLEGVNWLVSLDHHGVGGILGDEMGLGKTLQVISFLAFLKASGRQAAPHLVVAPLTVLSNWQRECSRWCPALRVLVLYGNERTRHQLKMQVRAGRFDVCLTTYETLVSEAKFFRKRVSWHYLILDEAQRIKNAEARVTRAAQRVRAVSRLCLTGTPVQNNMLELWSILLFLFPSLFSGDDTKRHFASGFDLANCTSDHTILTSGAGLLGLVMLRRAKSVVEASVPPKCEVVVTVPLSPSQRQLYSRLLRRALSGGALSSQAPQITETIWMLRKCANHPLLLTGEQALDVQSVDAPSQEVRLVLDEDSSDDEQLREKMRDADSETLLPMSGKLLVLDALLGHIHEQKQKTLVFSLSTEVLSLLERYCTFRGYRYFRLCGQTSSARRTLEVERFNDAGSREWIYLISTKAGGVGINLTSASNVIHFDSDFNPQNDLQAQCRSHRLGQRLPVRVFRLLSENTIDEGIFSYAQSKLFLDVTVTGGATVLERSEQQQVGELSASELMHLVTQRASVILERAASGSGADEGLFELTQQIAAASLQRADAEIQQLLHAGTVVDLVRAAPSSPTSADLDLASFRLDVYSHADAAADPSLPPPSADCPFEGARRALLAHNIRWMRQQFSAPPHDLEFHPQFRPQMAPLQHPQPPSQKCIVCKLPEGLLHPCLHCPNSYHPRCHQPSSHSKICPQHRCQSCKRSLASCGGLILRCVSCPASYCLDHLPDRRQVTFLDSSDSQPFLQSRGYLIIACSPECFESHKALHDEDLLPSQLTFSDLSLVRECCRAVSDAAPAPLSLGCLPSCHYFLPRLPAESPLLRWLVATLALGEFVPGNSRATLGRWSGTSPDDLSLAERLLHRLNLLTLSAIHELAVFLGCDNPSGSRRELSRSILVVLMAPRLGLFLLLA